MTQARTSVVEMNERTGAELGTQVWVAWKKIREQSSDLSAETFQPIKRVGGWRKPREGGLWTAQWDERYGGGWVQWCIGEEWGVPEGRSTWKHVWLLEPEATARVLVIDSYEDLERVHARWPGHDADCSCSHPELHDYPNWLLIAGEFDAVHVTEEGQWRTRLSHPLDLYGWDCESTLWLRWTFAETRYLGARTFEEKPYDD